MQPKAATKNFAVHYQVKKTGRQYKDMVDESLVQTGVPALIGANSPCGAEFFGLNFNKYIC